MIERIFSNWTITRAIYLGMGIFIMIQAVQSQQWFGLLFGGYFASMGLFAFGCAAGNCYTGPSQSAPQSEIETASLEVSFEEVK